MAWITTQDFKELCFDFAQKSMEFGQPIPGYETRNNDLLEQALAAPKHGLGESLFYPTLVEQGAILFYAMIKNHPFQNGNKRIAVMTLLVHLAINGKWMAISQNALYQIAITVASSPSEHMREVIIDVENLIESKLVDFPHRP